MYRDIVILDKLSVVWQPTVCAKPQVWGIGQLTVCVVANFSAVDMRIAVALLTLHGQALSPWPGHALRANHAGISIHAVDTPRAHAIALDLLPGSRFGVFGCLAHVVDAPIAAFTIKRLCLFPIALSHTWQGLEEGLGTVGPWMISMSPPRMRARAAMEAIGAQFRGRMSLSPSVYLLLDKPLFT